MNPLRASVFVGGLLAAMPGLSVSLPAAGAGDKGDASVVPVEQFTKEYAEDPAEFDRKYKGKPVTVEGVVSSTAVKVTATGGGPTRTFLMMDGYRKAGTPVPYMVRCEESGPDFEGIRTGHKVRIRGTAQGHSDTSYAAELRDCKVVKVFAKDYPPSPAVRAEVKKLQGVWKVVAAEAGGKKVAPAETGFTAVRFEGYQALLERGKQVLSFGLVIDPTQTPKHMDLTGNAVLPCAYGLEGDQLKLVLPPPAKAGAFVRPESLDSAQAKGLVLIAERQK